MGEDGSALGHHRSRWQHQRRYLLKGSPINPLFGRIASLWGARNPRVRGRTLRLLRAPPMLPNWALHSEKTISGNALKGIESLKFGEGRVRLPGRGADDFVGRCAAFQRNRDGGGA